MNNSELILKSGYLLDAYYKDLELFICVKEGLKKEEYKIVFFNPYFYISTEYELSNEDILFISKNLKGIIEIIKVKKENFLYIYKLLFENVSFLIEAKAHLQKHALEINFNFSLHEYDISFLERFFIDLNLSNFKKIIFSTDSSKKIFSLKSDDSYLSLEDLTTLSLDIEVLSDNLNFPTFDKNKIISISFLDNLNNSFSFFLKKKNVDTKNLQNIFYFENEIDLIKNASDFIYNKDPDIIFTYNGSYFDFDYLYKRYKFLTKKELMIGTRRISFLKKSRLYSFIDGILHIDVYILIRLLNYLQIFNFSKMDLTSVYESITSKKKDVLLVKEMINCYNLNNYKRIIDYNIDDCLATSFLGINYIGIIIEISKLITIPLIDVLNISSGNMVEKWFIKYYFSKNKIIPNKPSAYEISQRYKYTFTGAFVKDPIGGISENIAVVDFRSYHISIIIAYNISPDTINVKECNNFIEIIGQKICRDQKGFVPLLLEDLLNIRIPLKNQLKNISKDSIEYKNIYAKQYALKILLASTYGYMGFAGARWYCKDCLNIMYHLVRTKIQETIKSFENMGYVVIYSDTDSCFIKYNNLPKFKEDLQNINLNLPTSMSLELEDLFDRGIFVLSRDGMKVAKKKYALYKKEKDEFKIKGFEFVRRDWCLFVKKTQKKVLELILKDKDYKKAISFVKKSIEDLKNHNIPLEELIISSFVHKKASNYKTITPAMSALENAKKEGFVVDNKNVVEYIIIFNPNLKTISQRAFLYEILDKNTIYDYDYYLDHQLLPAVLSILEVFKITKDILLTGKKQTGLNQFF
ncbi:MAG: DNA-directed DNA polymerase [Candidatus ainarchaeum sp.]|nr:DNA-directed DNA polymerase [Candidatus ainarchaeum sp.]MDD3975631.1 DNA-directed DNA polymerase [Candidatus ainarchaeum sp.]